MKRISTPIKISILVLFIIFLLTRYISFIFTGVFETPAFFNKRNMQFSVERISFWPMGDFVGFSSLKSFHHMKKSILKWDSQAVVEIHENSMFISSKNPVTGKNDYYYICKAKSSSSNLFWTGDFGVRFENDKDEGEGYYLDFMIPMHLLCYVDDECPSSFYYGRGEEYEMIQGTTVEEVYEFYANSGYYKVELDGEKVVLQETYFTNRGKSNRFEMNYEIEYPVIIKVIMENEKVIFSCTIEDGSEEKGN